MSFFKRKILNEVPTPEPLIARNVSAEMQGLSFDDWMERYKTEHPYAQLQEPELENFNEYDGKIQHLIDTVDDMTAYKKEINELWDLVIDRLLPESDRIMEQDGVYYFALISITGEAGFDIETRKKIMNRLDNAIHNQVTVQFRAGASAAEVINDLNCWLSKEQTYLTYFGIGRSYSEVGYLKKLYEEFTPKFEELKQSYPAFYVDFVTSFKAAYQAVPSDYQTKFSSLLQHLSLQAVLVSRNAGFFDHYDAVLKDYYNLKLKDKKVLQWAYQFFTGYGEKPWRLVLLLLAVNVIFALLFTFLPITFNGVDVGSHWLARFGNFVYFNNTSMLTIGYGDIYPKDAVSKALVFILQLSGFSISSAAVALFLRRMLRF